MGGGSEPDDELEAQKLKALAETRFKNSKLKSALKYANRAHLLCPSLDGVSDTVTSIKILLAAAKAPAGSAPDWYQILQVDPSSHINTIKKQYKKLAFALNPENSSFSGSEGAFKLVCEAFRVLSDRVKRKEYDTELRNRLQAGSTDGLAAEETFWTECSRCSLLHQFERKYLGLNLVCPSCKRKFRAVEAERDGGESEIRVLSQSEGSVEKMENSGASDDDDDEKLVSCLGPKRKIGNGDLGGKKLRIVRSMRNEDHGGVAESEQLGKELCVNEWSNGRLRRRTSNAGALLSRSVAKRTEVGEEMMTLAEMQLEAKRKMKKEKEQVKIKEKGKEKEEKSGASKKSRNPVIETGGVVRKCRNLENGGPASSRKRADVNVERSRDLDVMAVEDSDFYDFDKDRVEKSFKQGQVWAIYDDDDGMPRVYGLIDEVISGYPFEVRMSWFDLQNSGDHDLISWEKMGFHISCGVYKVSRKTNIDSLNVFSHVMACERAAKEVYRIYPTKGSVWALYRDGNLDAEERIVSVADKRCYDIGVFLTSYSEMHGLSMAYLDKVEGFKSVFRRQEIGCHAIRWFEKDDVRLFSHQIPARKLSREDVPDHLKDCWELDPASLPTDMLNVGRPR